MVSTRSQSVLSAEAPHGDTGASHGEVNSAAPTPRRSGRLRSGDATTPATERAPPRTSGRARRLKAIEEEQETQEEQAAERQMEDQEQQQQEEEEAAPPSATPARGRRRLATRAKPSPAAAAAAAQEPQEEEEEEEEAAEAAGGQQPLKAGAAVVDLLAQEMFEALNEAFGERQGGSGGGSNSESDGSDQEGAQAARQQGQARVAADAGAEDSSSSSDSSGSGSESDENAAGRGVPRHLRWQPDLTLPGMQEQVGQQLGAHHRPGRGSYPAATVAAASAAAAAGGMHVVRRGGSDGGDGLHVPPPDERVARKAACKAAPDTAGRGWFDLPATQISEEVKRDLRLLRLRGALDPKAFYKKLDSTKFPKYFQMGTVVEGAADFYSGRLTNKQRKRTFTEEVMADEQLAEVRKKRYTKLQEEKQYWSKKKPGRKTPNERRKKAAHRSKH